MNIEYTLQKLYSLHQFHIKLGLERIEQLLKETGNPHHNFKSIHIAGSNGKGSTASFIASILLEAGYKVGLYTSPHLKKFNERIRINGKEIEDDYIINYMKSINMLMNEHHPTFFEITTAMAFKYFSDNNVDYAVIETGLGGRLDATNTIKPEVAIITSISYEHTNILGNSLREIATEKAGIIKEKINVIAGKLQNEAEEVIKEVANKKKCQLFMYNDFVSEGIDYLTVKLRDKNYNIYSTGLIGKHQLQNASIAIKAVEHVCKIKNISILNRGLKNISSNTGIEGRYEILSNQPRIIFDAAHNPEGVQTFVNEFSKEYKNYSERYLIFAAMRDKDIKEMLKIVSPFFENIFITSLDYERSASIEDMMKISKELNISAKTLKDPVNELIILQKYRKDICIAVLGSIYLLGEIKLKIENNS